MRIFENKVIFKKIVIVILIILISSFCFSGKVKAKDDGLGGKLLNPIMSLFVSLGDGAMTLIQKVVLHMDDSLVPIDTSTTWWAKFWVIVACIAVVSVIIISTVLTAGAATGVVLTVLTALKGAALAAIVIGGTTITFPIITSITEGMLPDSYELPLFQVTPQEIFSNKLPLLDVDFFNPTPTQTLSDGTELKSTATELRSTISNWYSILRDIALVALLSILVYLGIMILISSTGKDKAKYKQIIMDWIVAICLLFFMQYIMSFSNLVVKRIIEIIDTTQVSSGSKTEVTQPEVFVIDKKDHVEKAYEVLVKSSVGEEGGFESEEDSPYYKFFVDDSEQPAGEDSKYLIWPAENFMQQARLNSQWLADDHETYVAIGWKLIYIVLVIYTVIFLFTYIKRVIYMAFLTIIAPLVALTYPIDKINDGKAQAFNMWIKEYIFNLLIQPMHLILYTVLIGSAMSFASKNILYVIVALFFMTPAEKLLRSFFGFEKAKTPGLLSGPAGAALMMTGMNKIFSKSSSSKSSSAKGSNGQNEGEDYNEKLRFNDKFDKTGAMLGQDQRRSIDSTSRSIQNNDDFLEQKRQAELKKKKEEEEKKEETDRKRQELQQQLEQERLRMQMQQHQDIEQQSREQSAQQYKNSQKQERSPYFEDRIADFGREKIQQVGRGIQNSKIRLANSSAGRATRKIKGAIGAPMRMTRKIKGAIGAPMRMARQHSRIVDSGVKAVQGGVRAGARAVQAGASGAKYYASRKLENVGRGIQNWNPVKTAGSVAAGLTAATAGAIIGGVSGEPMKAAQYGLASGIAAYKGTDNLISNKFNDLDLQETKDRIKEDYYGDKIYEKEMNAYIRNFKANSENQRRLEKQLGSKAEAKEFMNVAAKDYLYNNITDIDDMAAGWKMEKQGIKQKDENGNVTTRSINRDMAIAGIKYGKRLGSRPRDMKEKDRKEWRDTISGEFANHSAFNKANMDKDKKTQEVFDIVNSFYDYKNK